MLWWSHFTTVIPSSPFGNRSFSQGPGNKLFNQYCPSEKYVHTILSENLAQARTEPFQRFYTLNIVR